MRARIGAPDAAADVLCGRCGARLGILWADATCRDGLGGPWLHDKARVTYATWGSHGVHDLTNSDWLSVDCVRCGFTWQGRTGSIVDLIARHPGGRVALGARFSPER